MRRPAPAKFLAATVDDVRLGGAVATANLFDLFGVEPALGRAFVSGEDEPGAADVALLSHGAWERHFGADPNIVGCTIMLNETGHVVIGVLSQALEFGVFANLDVWTPLKREAGLAPRDQRDLSVVGRLAPNTRVEAAQDEVFALSTMLQQEFPDSNAGWEARLLSFREAMVGPNAAVVFALLSGAAIFILIIACANVANLLLARAAARRQELAVRQALGARRGRLVRQLLTESTVLAVLGSAAGLVFAHWTLQGLVALARGGVPLFNEAHIDNGVLGFALGLALLTPLVFGVVPALRSTRVNLASATRESSCGSAGQRPRRMLPSTGSTLAALQVSLAVVLLVVASLASRSVIALLDLELGFDGDNLLTLRVELPVPDAEASRAASFFERSLTNIETTAAVEMAAWTSHLPLTGGEPNRSISIEGKPAAAEADVPWVAAVVITPDFFRTLGIPLSRGRGLAATDNLDARRTALVSEAAVERYWAGGDPLGDRVKIGGLEADGPWLEIVGVVADIRNPDADQPPEPHLYLPFAQNPAARMSLVARTRAAPAAAIDEVRQAIWRVDADQPIDNLRSMRQVLYDDLSGVIATIGLVVFFALVALALASAGVYSVISFSVSRRDREIGIRMALGAHHSNVLGMVLRQGVAPVIFGLALGLAAGFAASQTMAGMLFGVGPRDPVTFFGVPALLATVGLVASLVPAMRATRVDPLEAMRAE